VEVAKPNYLLKMQQEKQQEAEEEAAAEQQRQQQQQEQQEQEEAALSSPSSKEPIRIPVPGRKHKVRALAASGVHCCRALKAHGETYLAPSPHLPVQLRQLLPSPDPCHIKGTTQTRQADFPLTLLPLPLQVVLVEPGTKAKGARDWFPPTKPTPLEVLCWDPPATPPHRCAYTPTALVDSTVCVLPLCLA
jgi:hypothetical protein